MTKNFQRIKISRNDEFIEALQHIFSGYETNSRPIFWDTLQSTFSVPTNIDHKSSFYSYHKKNYS